MFPAFMEKRSIDLASNHLKLAAKTTTTKNRWRWSGKKNCKAVKGGGRQGTQKKRWEDNIREWTGLEFSKCLRAVANRKKN